MSRGKAAKLTYRHDREANHRAETNTAIDLLIEDARRDSFKTFKERMARFMLFRAELRNRIYAVDRARETNLADGLYVEFCTAQEAGSRLFGNQLKKKGHSMTGFDNFEGLE